MRKRPKNKPAAVLMVSVELSVTSVPVNVALFQQRQVNTSTSLSGAPPSTRAPPGALISCLTFISLSTKLTTRNVKLRKVRRPEGGSHDAKPAAWLCGICLHRRVKQVRKKQNKRKWVNQSRWGCVCVVLSVTVCVCVCVPQENCLFGDGGGGALRMDSPGARGCAVHH